VQQKLESRWHPSGTAASVTDNVMDSLEDNEFSMTNKVATAFRVGAGKQTTISGRARDKSDRATVEQVGEAFVRCCVTADAADAVSAICMCAHCIPIALLKTRL
jgi:hypothetical protein